MVTTRQIRTRTRLQLARARIPIPQLQPTTNGVVEIQEKIQQDISRVEQERVVERRRQADLIQRLKAERESPTSTSASRGALDDRIGESRKLLIQLGKARENIQRGFTFESSVSRATQLTAVSAKRRELKRKIERIRMMELPPKKVPRPILRKSRILRRFTIKTRELPPQRLIRREIVLGQPEKFAKSFRQATGIKTFTLAVPLRKQNGRLFVQDFNFAFKNGKLVKSKPTGSALITREQFLKVDKRRRDRNPGFTFGDTRLIRRSRQKPRFFPFKRKPFRLKRKIR